MHIIAIAVVNLSFIVCAFTFQSVGDGVMNEEELLQRAAEERATIVAKYRHGRKEGAIIDPWEDPEIQQYQNIDRYGFI